LPPVPKLLLTLGDLLPELLWRLQLVPGLPADGEQRRCYVQWQRVLLLLHVATL